jgi:HupE/UreJ protein
MSAVLLATIALLAHNPDTSYARIKISPDKVETRLTYDIFTLLKIVRLDDNGDGQLQRGELAAHAPQIAEFLRSKIGLAVSDDDESADLGQFAGFLWPPDVGEAIPGADFHSANGLIPFDFVRQLEQPPPVVAIAFGFFQEFTDRHTVLGVFVCRGQEYETTFSKYEDYFEYSTGYEPPTAAAGEPPAEKRPQTQHALAERLWRFFKMGVGHIFLGYDHICFLIALIVVSNFRQIVKIVTSFTIAHSITLILATLEVVYLPSRLIETCIAATIVYVAVENVWLIWTGDSGLGFLGSRDGTGRFIASPTPNPEPRTPTLEPRAARHRWLLTFFFGLIHGFGFANVLREMGLPTVGLVRCLLSFNLGVEAGQLMIALLLLPLAYALNHWKYGRYATTTISALLAAFGVAWFIDRAFALELMQRVGL